MLSPTKEVRHREKVCAQSREIPKLSDREAHVRDAPPTHGQGTYEIVGLTRRNGLERPKQIPYDDVVTTAPTAAHPSRSLQRPDFKLGSSCSAVRDRPALLRAPSLDTVRQRPGPVCVHCERNWLQHPKLRRIVGARQKPALRRESKARPVIRGWLHRNRQDVEIAEPVWSRARSGRGGSGAGPLRFDDKQIGSVPPSLSHFALEPLPLHLDSNALVSLLNQKVEGCVARHSLACPALKLIDDAHLERRFGDQSENATMREIRGSGDRLEDDLGRRSPKRLERVNRMQFAESREDQLLVILWQRLNLPDQVADGILRHRGIVIL